MSYLAKVKKGVIKKPHLVMIYGVDSVGKTTFGAQAPSPIFLGAEDGTNNLDVARLPVPSSWSDVEGQLSELLKSPHDYKSLVIDSLDWLEQILYQHICAKYKVSSIDFAAGGFGKGYTESYDEWIKIGKILTNLREEKGMNIILVAHADVIKFTDPQTQSDYDRYVVKLYKKTAAFFREFVDCVLFANFEIIAKKESGKTRAYGEGIRIVHTERRPGFDAKNRFGLPFTMPLSWSEYAKACSEDKSKDAETIRASILGLCENLSDQDLKEKVNQAVEKAADNIPQLEAIKAKLIIRIGE